MECAGAVTARLHFLSYSRNALTVPVCGTPTKSRSVLLSVCAQDWISLISHNGQFCDELSGSFCVK